MSGASKREVRRARELLVDADREKRSEGLDLCVAIASPEVAPDLVAALSRNLLAGVERTRALHVLADMGLARSLEDIRTDGWLDHLGAGVAGFEELCDIVGRPFVGFATLLGVQIVTLDVRADDVEHSRVGFTLGDAKVEHLPMREFKRRIVTALVEERPPSGQFEPPVDRRKAVELVGNRQLLLAGLFDWTLEWIYLAGPPRGPCDVHLDVHHAGRAETLTLDRLAVMLRADVEAEWSRYLDPLAGVSRDTVERARALLRTDPGRVIDLLGGLFRYALDFGRRSQQAPPDPELMATVCDGLALLGMAHSAASPDHVRYGEEVIRLGLQTFPGVAGAERLHLGLGDLLVRTGRHAEAIAHLRRAAALGVERDAAEALLAEAMFRSGRLVAAAVLYAGLVDRLPAAAARVGRAAAEAIERQGRPAIEAARMVLGARDRGGTRSN